MTAISARFLSALKSTTKVSRTKVFISYNALFKCNSKGFWELHKFSVRRENVVNIFARFAHHIKAQFEFMRRPFYIRRPRPYEIAIIPSLSLSLSLMTASI